MRKAIALLILVLIAASVHPAPGDDDFSRGIAYFLIGETDLAKKNLDAFFSRRQRPTVRLGFALLLQGEKWEATKKFRDYLESDHRSLEALTGISLATADMKNSLAIDNLQKVLRLNPGYAPAYLCLGHEYALRHNFPAAEENFARSLKYAAVPEFKILASEMYLKAGQPQQAADLIRPEADAAPGNFFYSRLAAEACLRLGLLDDASRYIDQALGARPDSREAQLLRAQHLLATGDLRKAKSLLGKLKFNYYNLDYSLTFAEVLVRLKDRDAEKYLYEVFSQNRWHPQINRLLGLYHLRRKNADVQNWIDRALLSGVPAETLRQEFPAQYRYPALAGFPLFEARRIQWLANQRLLVAGSLSSGEKERLLVLDAVTLKTLQSFPYEGSIQEFFPSPRLDKVIFSTTAVESEKVYIYTLVPSGNSFRLKPVIGYALGLPSILAGFNESGSMAYVTDGSLAELAFTSPFAAVTALGRKAPVYPNFSFPVYSYSYANERWAQIKGRSALESVPLQAVRRYLAVADAYQGNAEVAKLLDKGQTLDITSSEEMKILFGEGDDYFLISLSDLKNAFRAWVYEPRSNRLRYFDEAMFLGEKYYAELDIVAFHPEKGEILVCTRDKQRSLIQFNYHSLLYKKIAGNTLTARVSPDGEFICLLSERNKSLYFSEANLEIIQLSPYHRRKIDAQRDLDSIIDCADRSALYFTTFNGQLVKMDEEGGFSGRQVSLAGSLHQVSPDRKRAAAFINGRLFVLDWQD